MSSIKNDETSEKKDQPERDLENQESLNGTVMAVEAIHQLISNKFKFSHFY